VKKFNLQDTVSFHEPTHEVEKVLRTASIYAQPSAFEGFGISMCEAMSVGLPVVAYRSCPALNELVIHNSNGLLCDDGAEALGETLLKLMNDHELRQRLGYKAHEDMQAYKADIIWDKWEKLLESVR
jgi:glycosyltransferase involved in cell wall biosynthesis